MAKRKDNRDGERDRDAPRRPASCLDDVLAKGAADLNAFVPGMLKHKIAAMVFLPWLTHYTQRVRDVAQKEERDLILSIPGLPDKAKKLIRAWMEEA